jgi:hypothetical protein
MTDLAFRATYSDWKLVKTRGVVQVVMEVPLAEADAAYKVLGGMPDFGSENWFAVAALVAPVGVDRNKPEKEAKPVSPATPQPDTKPLLVEAKRRWRDLQPAAQAGIRCNEPLFNLFLKHTRPDDWHEKSDPAACVRMICGVNSRSELGTNHRARVIWKQLDDQYQAWMQTQ